MQAPIVEPVDVGKGRPLDFVDIGWIQLVVVTPHPKKQGVATTG